MTDELVLHEPVLGLDDFSKPRVLKEWEAITMSVLMALFGKPGFFPSIPEAGINIQRYRYHRFSEIDTDELRAKIIYQCNGIPSKLLDDLTVQVAMIPTKDGEQGALVITIPVTTDQETNQLLIGIKGTEDGIVYNYDLVKVAGELS